MQSLYGSFRAKRYDARKYRRVLFSVQSPAGLKGIKIWIIIPFKKYLNSKHLLLSTANFRESKDSQMGYLKAVVSNEDVDVIIAAPGETVVFRAGYLHMVFTVYPEGTDAFPRVIGDKAKLTEVSELKCIQHILKDRHDFFIRENQILNFLFTKSLIIGYDMTEKLLNI